MKLEVTSRKALTLGLVAVIGVSLHYLADSTAREKGRFTGAVSINDGARGDESGAAPPEEREALRTPPREEAFPSPRPGSICALALRADLGRASVRGERLPSARSRLNPHADRGRVASLTTEDAARWRSMTPGAEVWLPTFDGGGMAGVVVLNREEQGWVRVGGELRELRGTFALHTNFREVRGTVLLPDSGVAYEISTESSGEVIMVERPMEALLCIKYRPPTQLPQQLPVEMASGATVAQGAAVPVLNTRPGAKGVVFVDFDGALVTDPSWNGGRTITAAAAAFTPDQIRAVVEAVAEDFAPFDLTITTSQDVYNAAGAGRRMWVIVTPTGTAAPGSGGVAYVNSWSQAGKGFTSNVPCWVFNAGVKSASDTISHEVGHTLGLYHDGSVSGGDYYYGHGGDLSVSTSWGPIMGAPFSKSITQWSRGEYAGANNTQDDLFVISRDQNGFGYRTDSMGLPGLVDTRRSLEVASGSFDVTGSIRRSDLDEMHQFSTNGGTLRASVRPLADRATNADLRLELLDFNGATLAFSSPSETLAASVVKVLPAGSYWLVVGPAGTGERPAQGYTSGYSAYGSLGSYRLTGTLSNAVATPLLPPSGTVSAVVGTPLEYVLNLDPGVTVSTVPAPLPPGILFDAVRRMFVGTPTEAGQWQVRVGISNGAAKAEGVLLFSVELPLTSLAAGIDEQRGLRTSAAAPWTGVWMRRADGTSGPVAASGPVGDGSSSVVQFVAKGPAVMNFWWRVSSELSKDGLECLVNGVRARHSVDGTPLAISGETDWIPVQVELPSGARNLVEFRYIKDKALGVGSDRGWVYGVQIQSRPPRFRVQPRLLSLLRGFSLLRITAEVEDGSSYEWRLNGVTVMNEAGSARSVSGAQSSELCISGATAADSGVYQLVVKNASGTAVSRSFVVELPVAPVFVQTPVAPSGLRVGETLSLSAQVSGAGPLDYAWFRDGRLIARSRTPVLEIQNTRPGAAGTYVVTASNRFGSVTSSGVEVRFR